MGGEAPSEKPGQSRAGSAGCPTDEVDSIRFPAWAREADCAWFKWQQVHDEWLHELGRPGWIRWLTACRRHRLQRREWELHLSFLEVGRRASFEYALSACDSWRLSYPGSPDWMLPVTEEIAPAGLLAPGTHLEADPTVVRQAVAAWRRRVQPELRLRNGAVFPDSATLRKQSHFDLADLSPAEATTFEDWFTRNGYSRESEEFKEAMDHMTSRGLSRPGLVWRQHKVRVQLDGLDLRVAKPGSQFSLPYPVSCRSIPQPMGSIIRPLPSRTQIRDCREDIVYLEVWAHTGVALPKRPSTFQFENEVLLPARSSFKVIRHVDLPYRPQQAALPTAYAHGVQLEQLPLERCDGLNS